MTSSTSTFVEFLDPWQALQAKRDCITMLRSVSVAKDQATDGELAKTAHGLITFAVVLGLDDLSTACRQFEARVVEGKSSSLARQTWLDAVEQALNTLCIGSEWSRRRDDTGAEEP